MHSMIPQECIKACITVCSYTLISDISLVWNTHIDRLICQAAINYSHNTCTVVKIKWSVYDKIFNCDHDYITPIV